MATFFISRKKVARDVFFGIFAEILWCAIEFALDLIGGSPLQNPQWNSILLFPMLLIIAGWRAGLYEELLFRSLTMGIVNKVTGIAGIAIFTQAILFYLAHTHYLQTGLWYQSFVTGIMGLVMGYVTYKRKSIIPAIIVHSFSNTFGAIFLPASFAWEKAISTWW